MTELQNDRITEWQNDRQDKNNMPPDLRSGGHKNCCYYNIMSNKMSNSNIRLRSDNTQKKKL